MTIQDAVKHFGKSEKTIRRWIASGKLKAEMIDGKYHVYPTGQTDQTDDHPPDQTELVRQLREEISHLRETITAKDEQIRELHQLVGLAQKNVSMLTEQLDTSRALIEDMRRPWWRRLLKR